MKIAAPAETPLVNEVKLMLEQLPFDGAQVLELGCGKAEKTRLLAETGRVGGILARRTQALDVGLGDTAPYHWDGDMPDFDVLMSEVLAHRMGGKRQSTARGESFTRWMFAQQRPAADGADDLTLAAAGKQLFTDYACSKCHDGPAFGGQRTERIAGVDKQVPTLRRISLHPPFMHDGRSATLEAAIRDMIETTRETSAPDADVDAIAAYLRTL